MAEIIALVSGRGGVGKSTLAATLGKAVAQQGKSVLLLDFCVGLRQLDLLLGLESRVVFDLGDVLEDVGTLDQALLADPCEKKLHYLPAPQFAQEPLLPLEGLKILCDALQKRFDWILIDAPSGWGALVETAVRLSTQAVLVAVPEDAALRDAERMTQWVAAWGKDRPILLLNRVKQRWVQQGIQYAPETVIQLLDLSLIGLVPEDEAFQALVLQRGSTAFQPSLPALQSIQHIALRLMGLERIPSGWRILKPGLLGRGSKQNFIKEEWL